mgnify:CR=1 FL=1
MTQDKKNLVITEPEHDAEESPASQFRTKDIDQAAFIWCQDGSKLERLEGKTGRGTTIFFVFTLAIDERTLAKLIIDYANGDTLVEPKKYCQQQETLRDMLYDSLRIKGRKK